MKVQKLKDSDITKQLFHGNEKPPTVDQAATNSMIT